MKSLITLTAAILFLLGIAVITPDVYAQGNGFMVGGFVDENGDGFNDLAPDQDNDGIPNGQDDDYVRPLDGSGNQFGNVGNQDEDQMKQYQHRFMNSWSNGETIQYQYQGQGQGPGGGYGPGDGTGNDGVGPQDGSGYGPGGDGDCGGGPSRP